MSISFFGVRDQESPARSGGLALRLEGTEDLASIIAGSDNNIVNIAMVGDSIMEISSTTGIPYLLQRYLGEQTHSTAASKCYKANRDGLSLEVTSQDGVSTTSAAGARGAVMSAGDTATVAVTDSDGISIVYSSSPGNAGELTVRDGVGGTVLGTIDPDDTASSGRLWTSAVLSEGDRTYEIENTGSADVTLSLVYSHGGNVEAGVRVWNLAISGASDEYFLADDARAVEFIEQVDPEITIVMLGTNGGPDHTHLPTLIDSIRVASSTTKIVGVVSYVNNQFSESEADDIRSRLSNHGDVSVVVDLPAICPDPVATNQTSDGVHPETALRVRIASALALVVGCDPLSTLLSLLAQRAALDVAAIFENDVSARQVITRGTVSSEANGIRKRAGVDYIDFYSALSILFGGTNPDAGIGVLAAEIREGSAPTTPASGRQVIWARDNAGTSELMVTFSNGTSKVIANDT